MKIFDGKMKAFYFVGMKVVGEVVFVMKSIVRHEFSKSGII